MSSMRKRLERLERLQVGLAYQRTVRRRDCRGLELVEILARLEAVLPEEEYDAFDPYVGQQLEQWAVNGCDPQNTPGFFIWVCGLQEGWLHLPEEMPMSVLRSFVELHLENTPLQRCEDCLLGLPANSANVWQSCPACGSQRIYWADSNKPWGTYRARVELMRHLTLCKPEPGFLTDDATNCLGGTKSKQ